MKKPSRLGPYLAYMLWLLVISDPPAVAQCNGVPVAVDDTVSYGGGSALVVDVLANDSEPDGEVLEIDQLSTTCSGTLDEDLGLVTLTVTGFSAECTIHYRIRDPRLASDTATVTVTDDTGIFADGFETGDTSLWTP